MNPMYSGRTTLPDNLKSLFRPVSMIIPDSLLISEILLYSYGFHEAKSLAQKIVYTFYLAKQQLSQQVHYDFGLRAIKIILSSAGVLKLKASGIVELGTKFTEDLREEEIAEKEKRLDASAIEGISNDKSRSHDNFQVNSRATKSSKNSKKMKKSFLRKQTTRLQKEIKKAEEAAKEIRKMEESPPSPIQEEKPADLSGSDEDDKKEEKESAKSSDDISVTEEKEKSRSNNRKSSSIPKSKGPKSSIASKIDLASEKLKGKGREIEQLMDELGIESADLISDEKKIEEFIVLRAIKDTNLPKFHDTDTIIFESICRDIFKNPMKAKNKHTTLKNLIESVLVDKGCQVTEEIISRIMYLYQTITMRHGIMIVGATLSGKTTTISTLEETLKRSRDNEIQERTVLYKMQKAKLLGKKHSKKGKSMRQDKNILDEIKLTPDDLKIIQSKCKNEGVETYYINPKSITIDQLMGNFDETSHDWVDGILAYLMRE